MIGILESNRVYQPPVVFDFTQGIVGYWKLATDANDSSGNGHNGTGTMSYSGGYAQMGSTLLSVSDSDDFSFTDGVNDLPATFLICFNWNSKTGVQYILSKRDLSANLEWHILSNETTLVFRFFNPTSTAHRISLDIPISSISTGVLNTLILQYDGSKLHTGLKGYLNNVIIGASSMDGTYTGQVNGNRPVELGGITWGSIQAFNANSKEWAIWRNRIMTSDERQELHDRVIAGTPLI